MTIFTTRKRRLGQGNIFIPVCHSVHRGSTWAGTPPGTMYTLPGPGTPPEQCMLGDTGNNPTVMHSCLVVLWTENSD